jgi:DNA polymerase III alpha subunit
MISSFTWEEIESIEEFGDDECYDITLLEDNVLEDEPNFIANGFVVHNCAMDKSYANRKNGKEAYDLHPLIKPILEKTYGIIVYQEQLTKILNVVGDIPLIHCEKVRKAISKKKEAVFAKYKDQFIINGQKNLGWDEEKVKELWDQIVSFAEYGFCRSHAVAYSFISSKLLWLKTYYPLEFFAAILSCESSEDKVKEYKIEAEKFGIEILPVDLNKSKAKFDIVDNKIYIGFSNMKGIGEDPAQRIVEGQPYSSFEDFLHRFGTDASVLKPLIGIRAFKDDEPSVLWEFSEYYKDEMKKRDDRDKRYKLGQEKRIAELADVFTWETFDNDVVLSIKKKYKMAKAKWLEKTSQDKLLTMNGFVPQGKCNPGFDISDTDFCEQKFYGFGWVHMLEKSPDFDRTRTFEILKEKSEKQGTLVSSVQVRIIEKPKTITSKKKNVYYSIRAEDHEWHQETVKIWAEDFERFKEEFSYWENDTRKGNLVEIRLQVPVGNFTTYTFDSWPKQTRAKLCPKKKEDDCRLKVMRRPNDGLDELRII